MAYSATGLRAIGNEVNIYLYVTSDSLATVGGAGYFDADVNRFVVNDLLVVRASDGNSWYVVTDVDRDAGTVTVEAV